MSVIANGGYKRRSGATGGSVLGGHEQDYSLDDFEILKTVGIQKFIPTMGHFMPLVSPVLRQNSGCGSVMAFGAVVRSHPGEFFLASWRTQMVYTRCVSSDDTSEELSELNFVMALRNMTPSREEEHVRQIQMITETFLELYNEHWQLE